MHSSSSSPGWTRFFSLEAISFLTKPNNTTRDRQTRRWRLSHLNQVPLRQFNLVPGFLLNHKKSAGGCGRTLGATSLRSYEGTRVGLNLKCKVSFSWFYNFLACLENFLTIFLVFVRRGRRSNTDI